MANPTITEIIPGATQTGTSIAIPKAALATIANQFQSEILKITPDDNFVGFEPSSDNNAEEIYSALLMAACLYFTQARKDSDTSGDIQSVYEYSRFSVSTDIDGNISGQFDFSCTLYTPFNLPALDPALF